MNKVPMVGARFKSILTGRLYHVRMLTERFAVLEGEDASHRVYTEIGNLESFYEQVDIKPHRGESSLGPGPDASRHAVALRMTLGE